MKSLKDYRKEVLIVEDQLTGFKGKITGHADYITGCDQFLVQPEAPKGEWKDARWFDEGRLKIVGTSKKIKVSQLQAEENGADAPAPIK